MKYPSGIASFLFASLIPLVIADTCSSVRNISNLDIETSLSLEYIAEQEDYWSTGCSALLPSCILYPTTAEEMAAIVAVLGANNESFAVKSGGHNPNQYFASISGGPLISTKKLNEVTYDAATSTVRVGPGNRWEDVQNVLNSSGVTVVGGRIGDVGVGGYLLGGGLSFLSTEYGWAANNVVEFEVVLANATIITVSNSSNSDLFKALKGGGNNYGIVTAYTLEAHEQNHEIWGGNLFFTADKTDLLLAALRDFTEYYPDEKAAIIMTADMTALGVVDLWIMFLFYDGPAVPAGVFDNFTSIGPFDNTCKTQSYADLLAGNDWGTLHGQVYTISTETTPLPNATFGAEVLGAYYNHWVDTAQPVKGVTGLIASMAFQPMPKSIVRKAKEKGGDLIDLDDDVDRIILEFDYSWLLPSDDATMDSATQTLYGGMRELVLNFTAQGYLPEAYLPLFMNDGYFRQDYFGRLKTTDFARTVRDEYDPEGFFAKRTGGFKM